MIPMIFCHNQDIPVKKSKSIGVKVRYTSPLWLAKNTTRIQQARKVYQSLSIRSASMKRLRDWRKRRCRKQKKSPKPSLRRLIAKGSLQQNARGQALEKHLWRDVKTLTESLNVILV